MGKTAGNVQKVRTLRKGKHNGFDYSIDHVKVGKIDRFRMTLDGWIIGYYQSLDNAERHLKTI